MLTNRKITIVSDCVVDDERIATFGAILNLDNFDLSLTSRHVNKEACKLHKHIVRADQAEFDDCAYMIQDQLKGMAEITAEEVE